MRDPVRLLIADDHPLFRAGVVASFVGADGFQVVAEASSAEVAVDLAQRLRPDIVLMDVAMPAMGGIAATAQIVRSDPGARVVMLTVSEDPDDLFAALRAGARGYVLKGVSAAELLGIVRRVADGEAYVTPVLAAELLVEFSRPSKTHAPFGTLSQREAEVLELVRRGLTNREIGERLGLAEKTIKHHMTTILQKLHVRSRTEAALLADGRGRGGA